MRKKLAVCMLLAGLVGWGSQAVHAGKFMSQAYTNTQPDGARVGVSYINEAPNMVGPYGQPVETRAPAVVRDPTGADYARAEILQTYPREFLSQGQVPQGTGAVVNANYNPAAGAGNGIQQAQMVAPPQGGMPGGIPGQPGGMPGGPGGLPPGVPGIMPPGPPGAVAALGALTGQQGAPFGVSRTEIRFVGPAGMKIAWYAPRTDGRPGFSTQYLEAPARYNFLQCSIYRLKLSDIPNRPGIDLYPTLEVMGANLKTSTFLAHSSVPLAFTEEDFEQVAAGNFVVKVIYLPDPQFQDLAATGPDEVVSSRLEPGADPILEAKRRGSVLAIVRLGNIDLEAPNTPAMDSPDTNQLRAAQLQQQQQQQQMAQMQQMQQMQMQQMAMMRQRMMGGMPGGPGGQPNMAGMPPGMMRPGMMPPGMMPNGMGRPTGPGLVTPGMPYPGMPYPGMAPSAPTVPVNPEAGTPSAPTVPTPLVPGNNPATSPLGKAPTSSGLFSALFSGR